jgi:hypothetical protein
MRRKLESPASCFILQRTLLGFSASAGAGAALESAGRPENKKWGARQG